MKLDSTEFTMFDANEMAKALQSALDGLAHFDPHNKEAAALVSELIFDARVISHEKFREHERERREKELSE